jgi:hypothetical protein
MYAITMYECKMYHTSYACLVGPVQLEMHLYERMICLPYTRAVGGRIENFVRE